MNKHSVLNIVSLYREMLEAQGVKVERIILDAPSSRTAGNEDIGIVVISKDFHGKEYGRRIDNRALLLYDVFKSIDAVAMTPEEWHGHAPRMERFAQGEVVFGHA